MFKVLISILLSILMVSCDNNTLKTKPSKNNKINSTGLYAYVLEQDLVLKHSFNTLYKNTYSLNKYVETECSLKNRVQIQKQFNDLLESYTFAKYYFVKNKWQSKTLKSNFYQWPLSYDFLSTLDIKVAKSAFEKNELKLDDNFHGLNMLSHLINSSEVLAFREGNFPISPIVKKWENEIEIEKRFSNRCSFIKPIIQAMIKEVEVLKANWSFNKTTFSIFETKAYKTAELQTVRNISQAFVVEMVTQVRSLKNDILGIALNKNEYYCGEKSSKCSNMSPYSSLKNLYYLKWDLQALYLQFTSEDYSQKSENLNKYGLDDWLFQEKKSDLGFIIENEIAKSILLFEELPKGKSLENLANEVYNGKGCLSSNSTQKHKICDFYFQVDKLYHLLSDEFLVLADFNRPKDQGGDGD